MWKYVSRRIKDVYEKTYNVLDVRRTWTCGAERVCPDSKENSLNKVCNQELRLFCTPSHGPNSSSSSSEKEGFKRDYHHGRLHQTWLGAITWSSAIICGWYASQLVCLNRRHIGWDAKCASSKLLLSPSRTIHTSVLSYLAFNSPIRPQVCLDTFDEEDRYSAQQFAYPINNVHEDIKESKQKPSGQESQQPLTVDGAFDNLLRVLGEIEFQMGVQNLEAGDYATAVSHLKLATSHHHAGATFNLGLCYEQGFGLRKDMRMALECYQIASSMGHPQAMYNLGVFYAKGLGGLRRNRFEAKKYFLAAADLGQAEAKSALGFTHQKVVKKDIPNLKALFGDRIGEVQQAVAIH